LSNFESGSPARDARLRTRGLASQRSGDALTHVAESKGRIIGFCALSTASIMRSTLPGAMRRNAPDPIPALLIGQLAVDHRFQGRGIGLMLVRDAMRRALQISRFGGWRLLAVNPDGDAAAAFWAKLDFVPIPGASPALMVLTQTMVRRLLEATETQPV
jgi:predicted N-acetyltransferase YhbS